MPARLPRVHDLARRIRPSLSSSMNRPRSIKYNHADPSDSDNEGGGCPQARATWARSVQLRQMMKNVMLAGPVPAAEERRLLRGVQRVKDVNSRLRL